MPRISEFYGIVIAVYYIDHLPAHFHARYLRQEATISIETLEILEGTLPSRAMALILEWAAMQRRALQSNWENARQGAPLESMRPLE
jgi:uncharacterized protein DUF4160